MIGSLAAGCGLRGSSSDLDNAPTALDSSDSVEAEGNTMMAVTDGADMGAGVSALTLPGVVQQIQANIGLRWLPAGCATSTTNDSTITVVYNDCSGPRGLVHVSGTLDLAVSLANNVISVQGTATDFQVNGATLDIDANATYGVSGTTHTLNVTTQGSGTGPLGNSVDHNGMYTVTWDTGSQCGSLDGSWSTELSNGVKSATRSNDADVMRCAGGCPTGSLTHHYLNNATLTLTFDGTSTATWSTSTGKSGTLNLACQ